MVEPVPLGGLSARVLGGPSGRGQHPVGYTVRRIFHEYTVNRMRPGASRARYTDIDTDADLW